MASLNVLLVEDHPGARWVAEDILMSYGHSVTSCENGAVALELCHEQGGMFDVILLNAQMPILDGAETARMLREHPATKDVPIIGVSAFDAIPGADENVYKPDRRKDLLQAITQAISIRTGGHSKSIQTGDTNVTPEW